MNILVHGTFLGYGGIAHHSREFTKALSNYHNVKIRNYNLVDLDDWEGYTGPNILKNARHLEDVHHKMLYQQTLMDGELKDFPLSGYDESFVPDFHLIMAEVNHYYHYNDYKEPVIVYFFWETTHLLPEFIDTLHSADYVWVPSEWQLNVLINNGIPKEKISVVNAGIYPLKFFPSQKKESSKLRLLHVGTWEYRKSTYEIVNKFLKLFGESDDVELRLGIHNKLRYQDSPRETFEKFGLPVTKNIIFLDTLSEDQYIKELQETDLYISCSRGEGWNLPLIQSMSCGVPSIYSECGGQLEFVKNNLGIPIKIKTIYDAKRKIIINGNDYHWESISNYKPNNLYEPDYYQLEKELKLFYNDFKNKNLSHYIEKSINDSKKIHSVFNWDYIAKNTNNILKNYKNIKMSNIYYLIHSTSFGDTLAATPTLRYLSKSHQQKINVVTFKKDIFKNNPYVEDLLSFDEFNKMDLQNIIKYESHTYAGKKDGNGIEKKFSHMDVRQIHAFDLGFQLPNEDLEYDLFPDPLSLDIELPEKYVVLHVTTNWPNRTWDYQNWVKLIKWLKDNKIFTVLIGAGYKEKLDKSYSDGELQKDCPMFDDYYGLDLTNKGSIGDMWWVIKDSECIVTMDSGPLHLASCTDTHIIQLGSAINPTFKRFYRNGDWSYKYHFLGGSCKLFCNSNLFYNIKEWGDINSVPPMPGCLENKPTFECHPKVNDVVKTLKDILKIDSEFKSEENIKFGIYTSFYNCERFIDNAFLNIEKLNYDNFEWHITDDFSTDDTKQKVLERLEKSVLKDKIIYYEQSEKKEMYWKPNLFFDNSFEWIVLVDADDEFDSDFLNVYNNNLKDKNDVYLVSSDFFKINKDNNSLHSISYIKNEEKISEKINKYHPQCDYLNNISYSCYGTLRGFRNIIPSFDVDDMLACAEDSYHVFWTNSFGKYLHIPRPMYTWYMRSDSESHSKIIPPNFNANFDIALSKLKKSDHCVDNFYDDVYIETCTLGSEDLTKYKNKKVSLWSQDLTIEQKNKIIKLYPDINIVFNQVSKDINLISLNYFTDLELKKLLNNISEYNVIFYYQNNKKHDNSLERDNELENKLSYYKNIISEKISFSWWTYIRHFIIRK